MRITYHSKHCKLLHLLICEIGFEVMMKYYY